MDHRRLPIPPDAAPPVPFPAFGTVLRRLRGAAGLTQELLAERASLGVRSVSDLERGLSHTPRRETVRLLADALALSPPDRALLEATARGIRSPPLPPLLAHIPHNLPEPLMPLVGRTRLLARAVSLMRQDAVRLVTVTGPGGVGKTRVVLALAVSLIPDYPDGVFFVPLASLDTADHLDAAIAWALGMKLTAASPHETLRASLREKRLLLVLDNFEHLLSGAVQVADLLAHCPDVVALVSSRAALHVRGEHEFPVPPLALPDLRDLPDAAALSQTPAVRLFCQHARAVTPDFRLNAANAAAVAAICVQLDGLPLAIELAASRVRLFPPAVLLLRLAQRLPELIDGAHDAPVRQQTMRAAIGWSYHLLDSPEQRLFRHLTVFAGGWTLTAAEAVCGTKAADVSDLSAVLGGLASLVETNLVSLHGGTEDAPRFGMLETVREYGAEVLVTGGEAEVIRQRHAAHFLALAEAMEWQLAGPNQAAVMAQLAHEHDNLRVALRWTSERGEAEIGLRLAGALWRFWQTHGHFREGREWLDALLALSVSDGDAVPPRVRTKALIGAAMLAFRQNDYDRAAVLSNECLALARATADDEGTADALNVLGLVADNRGDFVGAAARYEESLALYRQAGVTGMVAISLNNLGFLARTRGEYAHADALLEESLLLHRRLGNTWGIALALSNLGRVAQNRGDFAGACLYEEESLTLRRALGDSQGIVISLTNLGHSACAQGDRARAASLFTEGLALSLAIGDRKNAADTLNGLGDVARDADDLAGARARYVESVTQYRAVGHVLGIAEGIERLAQIAHHHGQHECAVRLLGATDTVRATIGAPLPAATRAAHDTAIATARAALGESAFAAAWEAGCALALEQATDEAIGTAPRAGGATT